MQASSRCFLGGHVASWCPFPWHSGHNLNILPLSRTNVSFLQTVPPNAHSEFPPWFWSGLKLGLTGSWLKGQRRCISWRLKGWAAPLQKVLDWLIVSPRMVPGNNLPGLTLCAITHTQSEEHGERMALWSVQHRGDKKVGGRKDRRFSKISKSG